jgi:hypothetical protein
MTRGYKGRETYPNTLLNTENSARTKDTWCTPRFLNVVREGVGDECVHEKLKADRFHLWCRDTSLPAFSEAARTPPRTESWVAVWLEFFSRPTSELLLDVVDEDGGTTCLAGIREDRRDGLVTGWPRTSRRENKSDGDVELGRMGGLVLAIPTEGFFLWSQRGCNGHPNHPGYPVVATRDSTMVSPWGLGDVIVAAGKKRW